MPWNETMAPFVVLGKFVSEDGRASKNENCGGITEGLSLGR